jgi:hypothetical protein
MVEAKYVEVTGDTFAARCPHCNAPVLIEVGVNRWPKWADLVLAATCIGVLLLCVVHMISLDGQVKKLTDERDNMVRQLSGE